MGGILHSEIVMTCNGNEWLFYLGSICWQYWNGVRGRPPLKRISRKNKHWRRRVGKRGSVKTGKVSYGLIVATPLGEVPSVRNIVRHIIKPLLR